MNIEEKKLWAILVPGPDDVWAMESKEAAELAAKEHNELVANHHPELAVYGHVTAIVWPHSAEAHAQCLADEEAESLDE